MKVHRDNLLIYLKMALHTSIGEDSRSYLISKDGESFRTAALKVTIEAVERGETLEYFKE